MLPPTNEEPSTAKTNTAVLNYTPPKTYRHIFYLLSNAETTPPKTENRLPRQTYHPRVALSPKKYRHTCEYRWALKNTTVILQYRPAWVRLKIRPSTLTLENIVGRHACVYLFFVCLGVML